MTGKTATIIGATGMIGHYLLELLLNDSYFETVRILVRRPLPKTHPKMEVKLVNFKDAESFKLVLEGTDIIFSCIGTTQQNVKGNKTLYREIDLDIPVNAARFGKETGVRKFIVVTAVGASSKSSNFYLKLKGEIEDSIAIQQLPIVHVFQPSMLLGERKEKRVLEQVIGPVMKGISFLLAGSLAKYRAIHGKDVAKAMISASKLEEPGFFRHEYSSMKKLIVDR